MRAQGLESRVLPEQSCAASTLSWLSGDMALHLCVQAEETPASQLANPPFWVQNAAGLPGACPDLLGPWELMPA